VLVDAALFYFLSDYGWDFGHEDSRTVHPL